MRCLHPSVSQSDVAHSLSVAWLRARHGNDVLAHALPCLLFGGVGDSVWSCNRPRIWVSMPAASGVHSWPRLTDCAGARRRWLSTFERCMRSISTGLGGTSQNYTPQAARISTESEKAVIAKQIEMRFQRVQKATVYHRDVRHPEEVVMKLPGGSAVSAGQSIITRSNYELAKLAPVDVVRSG